LRLGLSQPNRRTVRGPKILIQIRYEPNPKTSLHMRSAKTFHMQYLFFTNNFTTTKKPTTSEILALENTKNSHFLAGKTTFISIT